MAKPTRRKARPVYQSDKNGYIATYPDAIDAAAALNIYAPSITKACKGQSTQAGGFKWSYTKPEPTIPELKQTPEPTPEYKTRREKREATRKANITPKGHNLVLDIETSRYIMAINDNIPQYFLVEMKKAINCDCTIEAYENFINNNINLTKTMQSAIIKFYKEKTGERLRKSSCSSCWARRVRLTRGVLNNLLSEYKPAPEKEPIEN